MHGFRPEHPAGQRQIVRLEVRRRYVHRGGPSCACEYAVSGGIADATGSKPLPSRNDVHYVADSTGVGKTFLSKIVGWRICQANQRILFTTAMDMLNHLLASQVDHSLVRKLKTYTEPTALVVDELGYLALDQQTSNLFYQVISTRHSQKRSTIITTNTLCGAPHNVFNAESIFMRSDRL